MTPEKDPWNRHRRNLKLVAERRGSGLRLWAILVAGVVGLVVLLVWAFPQRALGQADWVRLVELGAFFALCASGVVYWRRAQLGETLRNLAIWVAVGAVLLLGYSFRHEFATLGDRLAGELLPSRAVEVAEGVVEVRAGLAGHFVVTAAVNGAPVDFLIDTGASDIVLSPADAARLGYHPENLSFTRVYHTANGVGRGAPIRLDSLAVGPIGYADLPASVNEAPMGKSLLGMTFLRRLASYEVRGDVMILRR
ncbi:MAG TPA: TIGR02281 family clan AA aspartic protease [Kiloniellaceae bacterium]